MIALAPAARADINPRVLTFKDWTLVCDNVRRCEARSLTPGADATVSVIREGGPGTPLVLRLASEGFVPSADLRVDDMPSALSRLDWSEAVAGEGGMRWLLEGDDAVHGIALLRNAATLTLGQDGTVLSLSGMTAALLAMEDHQGRLDTHSAIVRQGDLPDSRAWPASPLPVVSAARFEALAPDAHLVARARASREADRSWECPDTPEDPQDLGFGFTAHEALVFVECERLPHSSRYLPLRIRLDDSAPAERVIMTMVADAQYLRLNGVPAPQVDAERGRLILAEAQGGEVPLDEARCGLRGTWQFDGEHVELIEYAEQTVCAGVPGDWPVWYRAAVRD